MRLERLEIAGFKSFSDRAELAFDQGVTAIVGPNGCGKSNVADAITWVLGEQSAKSLRGEKMEDVIFSGSDARKPGAAAEVRLRLSGLLVPGRPGVDEAAAVPSLESEHPDQGLAAGHGPDSLTSIGPTHLHRPGANGNGNGNGHGQSHALIEELVQALTRDVEVTRRLYRSGESEYLIDGEVCRLRDVHELLMDTGLGAKAYSIIEQGKIGLILSSRPADRRQLIEEAAGITKYKSRRRSAELKLEAAQQNLTRIDDIVFEVDRQRGALKRQAGKARRYSRLREELRRWEKVLFAGRYRELALEIEAGRTRLSETRERETAAGARLAEVEADLSRLKIEHAEAEAAAAGIRERAHARDLDVSRRQHQLELNRHHAQSLEGRIHEIAVEVGDLEARREPARVALESRRLAATEAEQSRDHAATVLAAAADAVTDVQRQIEGLEHDVEAARGDVFSSISSVTALRHAMENAAAQRERVGETLAKLDVEEDDLRREREIVDAEYAAAGDALGRAHDALDSMSLARAARESELATARGEREWRARSVRTCEQELAAIEARLASLEELSATRGEFGDAARVVLVQANGHVGQQGAVADYLEVDSQYERAVEACLGDLLQHVIVERHDQAAAGLSLVRDQNAGRCGFVVVDPESNGYHPREALRLPGVIPVSDVVRILGPHALTIQKVLPEAYVAESFDQAVAISRDTSAPVATLDGDVLRGPHLVSGGAKVESRGILATRRQIKELRARVAADRETLARTTEELSALEMVIAEATAAIATLHDEQHEQEKVLLGSEGRLGRASDDAARLSRKRDVIALERRQAEEEGAAVDARAAAAQAASGRLQEDQQSAQDRLSEKQGRLTQARGSMEHLGSAAADARASHAGLVERAAGLALDVIRFEEAARELEERVAARIAERLQTETRRVELLQSVADGERTLDDDIRSLAAMREELAAADDGAAGLRTRTDAQDAVIREARRMLDAIREEAGQFEIARAKTESDLAHLAQTCVDAVQESLDDVLAAVERMEQAGDVTPDAAVIGADEPEDAEDGESEGMASGDGTGSADAMAAAGAGDPAAQSPAGRPAQAPASMTAEEAMVRLKAKIDRLGPVNMMAIEQFDELETRHQFLTTQRQDLIDSIAQTSEAISRIDETTRARFSEAFTAIQANFQQTFATLFGGGRAGLTLLDENDPLECGIEIVASPPGKRLQSVQLLSGGEKALTAIALMFAIFRYKPSPFCLLDEIDAPLDDANVSRFVEMLRGMLDRTQFILITHNRRTMEIANRLYGVTMEEPGVSKLISVQLN